MHLDHRSGTPSQLPGLGVHLGFIPGQEINLFSLNLVFMWRKPSGSHRTLWAVVSPADHQTRGLPWQASRAECGCMVIASYANMYGCKLVSWRHKDACCCIHICEETMKECSRTRSTSPSHQKPWCSASMGVAMVQVTTHSHGEGEAPPVIYLDGTLSFHHTSTASRQIFDRTSKRPQAWHWPDHAGAPDLSGLTFTWAEFSMLNSKSNCQVVR